MSSDISDKDKKDWEDFVSRDEKLPDKDINKEKKNISKIKHIDLHGYSLEEANKIIDNLEKEKDLQNSLDSYQKLIKLNNTIEKKFYARSKEITQDYKDRIKKNEKKT